MSKQRPLLVAIRSLQRVAGILNEEAREAHAAGQPFQVARLGGLSDAATDLAESLRAVDYLRESPQ